VTQRGVVDPGAVDAQTADREAVDPEADGGRPVVLVGYSRAWLGALEAYQPPRSLVVVEEPDVARKRGLPSAADDGGVLRELVEWEYQLDGAADEFFHRHRDLAPAAVVPVVEYGVPFAARLAERYGVPGATYGAAALLRDKHLLRGVTAAAGVANPRSVLVRGPDEVKAFMVEVGGPVVLKPANRQASIGTKIIFDPVDIERSWLECLEQDEGVFFPDRAAPVRMLAERYLRGEEFSVELMVRGGAPVFGAVTRKYLFDGPRPVEQGHLHPADIDAGLSQRLLDGTARVLDAVGMDTGFVHCEWIVEDGVPHLVECAGRLAGGGVMDLVVLAWRYDAFGEYWRLMRGQPPAEPVPAAPARSAAAWLARAPAGEVLTVAGVEEAGAGEGVHACWVTVAPGEHVGELRSSWDRVALVMAHGATPAQALANARRAIDRIVITVRQPGPA
jgi:biotin carboxylase